MKSSKKHHFHFCFLGLFLFGLVTHVFSRAEKYDPMAIYKKRHVTMIGPKEEKLIDVRKNRVIASAKYFYNKKNQLIRAQYYLANKPDGETKYKYNLLGHHEEVSFDTNNRVVEKIRYEVDQSGNTSSYRVLKEKIKWRFFYEGSDLRLGKRYVENKLTEYFVFTKRTKRYCLQSLFVEGNQRIGFVEYFYKKGRLVKRIKKDNLGKRKAEHYYSQDGRLKEILLFEFDPKQNYWLDKKQIFVYSSRLMGFLRSQ